MTEDVVCKASRNLFIPVRLDNFVRLVFMIMMQDFYCETFAGWLLLFFILSDEAAVIWQHFLQPSVRPSVHPSIHFLLSNQGRVVAAAVLAESSRPPSHQ